MIRELEQTKNWQFIYLGADLDSFADAEALGLSYKVSSRKSNLKQKFGVISEHAVRFRMAEPDADKLAMMGAFMEDLKEEAD